MDLKTTKVEIDGETYDVPVRPVVASMRSDIELADIQDIPLEPEPITELPATAAPAQGAIRLPLDIIDESPSNPRKIYKRMDELAKSIESFGVLQPVLVRPSPITPGRYELAFGHRRLRASKMAQRHDILAVIRELTDQQVLEAQLVENRDREDVHPLEEAEVYRRLHVEFGIEVEAIAAEGGKGRGYVYARLKLCELCPAGQKAFYAECLDTSVALLIARMPSTKLQQEAVKRLASKDPGDRVTYRDAVRIVEGEFMLRLSEAPFNRTDPHLVPEAGGCAGCPKRTGNQSELFSDVKSADVCTDPPCFARKVDAHWAARRKAGFTVLSGKAADEAINAGHLRLDADAWDLGLYNKTYRQLMGKDLKPEQVVYARSGGRGDREVVELVPRGLANEILKAKGISKKASSSSTGAKSAGQVRAEQSRIVGQRAVAAVMAETLQLQNDPLEFWRWLAGATVDRAWHDSRKAVVARRGLGVEPAKVSKAKRRQGKAGVDHQQLLLDYVATASIEDCQGLCVEMLIVSGVPSSSYNDKLGDWLVKACDLALVDVAKIRAEVTAEAKEKAAAKKAKKSKGKKAPAKKGSAPASKGTDTEPLPKKPAKKAKAVRSCRVCGCTEADCRQCIEKTGWPCSWVEPDLCSACVEEEE